MKVITLNFLTCARKTCKNLPGAFPLHPRDAELEIVEAQHNPLFIHNILPRIEWPALRTVCAELGLPGLPDECPAPGDLFEGGATGEEEAPPTQVNKELHSLLMETTIQSGKLVCGNCGHEYAIKEGIANFLLPSHMV